MLFRNASKTEDNFFKSINTQAEEDIKTIEQEADPVERLKRYKSLSESFNSLYGGGEIQKTVDDVFDTLTKERDRKAYNRSVGGWPRSKSRDFPYFPGDAKDAAIGHAIIPLILSMSPLTIPVALLSIPAAYIGYRKSYNKAAKKMGLTRKDLKYIVKAAHQKFKVEKAADAISASLKKQQALLKEQAHAAEVRVELDKLAGRKTTKAAPASITQ